MCMVVKVQENIWLCVNRLQKLIPYLKCAYNVIII